MPTSFSCLHHERQCFRTSFRNWARGKQLANEEKFGKDLKISTKK